MNKRPSFYKRTLWVDRSIQLPLLTFTLAMATVGTTGVAAFSVYYVTLFPPGSDDLIVKLVWFLAAFLCYGIMLWLGLFVTNRVAGPLIRMKEHMEALNRGERPEPLTARKDDFVNHDLIKAYNDLVEKNIK